MSKFWYVFANGYYEDIIYIGNSKEECKNFCEKNNWKLWQDKNNRCFYTNDNGRYNFYIKCYEYNKSIKIIEDIHNEEKEDSM